MSHAAYRAWSVLHSLPPDSVAADRHRRPGLHLLAASGEKFRWSVAGRRHRRRVDPSHQNCHRRLRPWRPAALPSRPSGAALRLRRLRPQQRRRPRGCRRSVRRPGRVSSSLSEPCAAREEEDEVMNHACTF